MRNKKGIAGINNLVLSLVIVAFTLAIGLSLVSQTKDTMTANTVAYNATATAESALADIPGWLPVIVLAFIAVIVLGVVYMIKRR